MAKVKVDPDVQKLIDEYNSAYNILCRSGEFLYGARLSAAKTIANVEDLVNSIANHPKTFDTNIEAIKFNKEKFAGAQAPGHLRRGIPQGQGLCFRKAS